MDAFNSLECTGSCLTAGAGDRERFHSTRLREHSQNPGSEEGTQHHTFGFHTDAIWKSRVLFAALTRRRAQRICSRETLNKHTSHPVENGGWTSSAVPRGLRRLAVTRLKSEVTKQSILQATLFCSGKQQVSMHGRTQHPRQRLP